MLLKERNNTKLLRKGDEVMKKRGLALLLTAGLLAGLTGCAASGEDASDGAEKVRLMVWSPSYD